MQKQSKGITLISLVVTIIILLILAGISISALTGSGLFEKAKIAKSKTQEAQELENQMLLEYEKQIYELDNIDGKWIETNSGITNGKITLQIGDYVNYVSPEASYTSPCGSISESKYEIVPNEIERGSGFSKPQTFNTQNYTGGWKVLGIDEKSGGLKLVSADIIKTIEDSSYNMAGFTGYYWGEIELDSICKIFGKGLGCKEARSIKYSDINKVTGYNPLNTGNGEIYKKGDWQEFGNEVTYLWADDVLPEENAKIVYSNSSNGNVNRNGSYSTLDVGFELISDNGNKHFEFDAGRKICTVKSISYRYYPTTLTDKKEDEIKGLSPDDNKYLTLYCNEQKENIEYFVGNRGLDTHSNNISYTFGRISNNNFNVFAPLYNSTGYKWRQVSNVRPVIILEEGIEIERWRWKK